MKKLLLAVAVTVLAIPVSATIRTVTLVVPSMDCPVCPITVKKVLTQLPGVSQVSVNFGQRQAVVMFDDARTNVGALIQSTKDAGYPATALGSLK